MMYEVFGMNIRIFVGMVCLLSAIFGCKEKPVESPLTPAQQQKVDQHILTEPPPSGTYTHVGAVMDDQVELIGYSIDRKTVKPGGSFTVTYYIRALAEQMKDNLMFVHLQRGQNNKKTWMNLDHHPVEGLLPLRKLKKGQIVKDVHRITVKREFTPGPAQLYWGLWTGTANVPVKNASSIDRKVDKDGRLELDTITISGKPKPLPIAFAKRLTPNMAMTIDGKLEEEIWKSSPYTGWWQLPSGNAGPSPKTRAKFAWDDQYLYVAVECDDSDVWGTLTERDSDTWTQEVVELFIDADGERKDYIELQVTPANTVFDALFVSHRSDLKTARAWNLKGWKTAVHVDGTLNQREDIDQRWTVEMAIPHAEVPGATVPPKPGSQWKANLFRFDQNKGLKRQQAAAFSPPIVGDFHHLKRFGTIRFEGLSQPKKPGRTKPLLRQLERPTPKQGIPSLAPSSVPGGRPQKNTSNH